MGKINRQKGQTFMNNKQKQDTIQKRQAKNKELVIEQLKKSPVVELVCQKANISRATYYRWRQEDKKFTDLADKAISEGNLLINDMAEAQLLRAIRDNNFRAIVYWLKNHHPTYATKIELTTKQSNENESLTPAQEAMVKKAIALVQSNNITK